MKQLVISPTFPHSYHTFVTREIAESLKRGIDVVILAPGPGDDEGIPLAQDLGIGMDRVIYANVEDSPIFSPNPKRWMKSVSRCANKAVYGRVLAEKRKTFFAKLLSDPRMRDIDLIHSHFAGWSYDIALPLSRLLHVPFIVVAHDGHLKKHPNYLFQELQREANAISCPSQAWIDTWASKTGYKDKLVKIPNAINVHEFQDIELKAKNMEITMLTTARLIPAKRVADGIKVVNQLSQKGVKLHYKIIGGGDDLDKLKSLVTQYGIEEMVQFIGVLPFTKVLAELSKADIYFHPSGNESFGIAMIEAMGAGLPVIAAKSGGAMDIVVPDTGVLCEIGDIDALAKAVAELASSAEMRASQGIAGRARAISLYSWESRMDSLMPIWEQALTS
jgi:glycosyltransferase involved in cell wall biosynthesis